MLPLLARRVGARRVRATADVCVEWPERRRGAARRKTWGRRGQGSGGSAVAAAGAVAWGRYWGGRGVLPLACHGRARLGRRHLTTREVPERRCRDHGIVVMIVGLDLAGTINTVISD